jgi:hypothetical protein
MLRTLVFAALAAAAAAADAIKVSLRVFDLDGTVRLDLPGLELEAGDSASGEVAPITAMGAKEARAASGELHWGSTKLGHINVVVEIDRVRARLPVTAW